MSVSGVNSSNNILAYQPQPKGNNTALSYNHKAALDEQNAKTGSQFTVEKERAAAGADIITNLVI